MIFRQLFVLCVLALLLGVQAQTSYFYDSAVFFNNSYDCGSNGCYINNPAIYEGGVLPTDLDEVIFNVTLPDGITLIVPSNAVYNVSELSIFGTTTNLIIEPYASLCSIELSIENASIHVQSHGAIITYEEASLAGVTVFVSGSIFSEDISFEGATVFVSGSIISEDITFENSTLLAQNQSVFTSEEFEFDNGIVEFDEGCSYYAYESDFTEAEVQFLNRPYLGEAEFERVNAYFPVGFYIESEYSIFSSNFTAYLPDELANVRLILEGKNNLNFSNLIFAPNKIIFNNGGFMTFTVSNNAAFNGTLNVPGEIIVNSGSSVVFNGSISLTGGIQANVDSSTHIRAFGALTTRSPILLSGRNGVNEFNVVNAILNTPVLKLDKFSLRALSGTNQLYGSIINDGSIQIYETSSIVVHGNYSQVMNATLELVGLTEASTASLFVNGTANITGDIKYNVAGAKKGFTAIVLQAHPLIGKFISEAFTGDVSDYSTKLDYSTPNQVKIVIDPERHPLHWWVVFFIVATAFIVIATVVFGLRRYMGRSQYQQVVSS